MVPKSNKPFPKSNKPPPAGLRPLPELVPAESGETFGLVKAGAAVADYYNLVPIKNEPLDDLVDLSSEDPTHATDLCNELGIDPALMLIPRQQAGDPQVTQKVAVSQPAPPSHTGGTLRPTASQPPLVSHALDVGHTGDSIVVTADPSGSNTTAASTNTTAAHNKPTPPTLSGMS